MRTLSAILVIAAAIATGSAQAQDAKEVAALAKTGKAALLGQLKDADSAKLRGLFVSRTKPMGLEKAVALVLCGEVNARNSMGGYTGFKRFYTTGGSAMGIEGESDVFDSMHTVLCSDKVRDVK